MDLAKIIKILLVLGVIVIGIPILLQLLREPLNMERIIEGLKKSDLGITEIRNVEPPTNESVAQIHFEVNGAFADIYQYDDEGKIARYAEMYKQDPGTAIVEAWGLAQSLGAAPSKNKPQRISRRRMYLLVVQGDDTALLDHIVKKFSEL